MKEDANVEQRTYTDDQSGGDDDSDFQSDYIESRGYHSGSKADMRKSNKPIMEKRRRARINNCLNGLKGILLEAMRKDPARHSKLEKADILELTVRHLQNVQRNQLAIAMATDPTVLHRFKNGFSECATEVGRYLGRLDGVDPGIRQRLTGHLGACVNGLQQVGPTRPTAFGSPRYPSIATPFAVPPSPVTPNTHGLHPSAPQPCDSSGLLSSPLQSLHSSSLPGDMNNNSRAVLSSPLASSTVTSGNFEIHRLNISNRMNFGLTVPPKVQPTPPPSPPLDQSQSHPGLNDSSLNRRNRIERGVNVTPSIGKSVTGTSLDLSLGKKCDDNAGREVRTARFEHIESIGKLENDSVSSAGHQDSMWRPW